MARPAALYVCQSCGSSHNRWAGKCDACGEWNSIVEESMHDRPQQVIGRGKGKVIVEDKEFDFDTLDVLSIPVFQWHQYFNTGSEPLRILGINTRLAMDNLGLSLTHQGEHADYV